VAKQEFICEHCGRRVLAERGPLTVVKLCRSCFEKARTQQRSAPPKVEGAPKDRP
jgi:hypothetical protein